MTTFLPSLHFSLKQDNSDDDSDNSDFYSFSDSDYYSESSGTTSTISEYQCNMGSSNQDCQEEDTRRRSNSEFNPLLVSLPTVIDKNNGVEEPRLEITMIAEDLSRKAVSELREDSLHLLRSP